MYKVTKIASLQPVSITEFKEHLKVDGDYEERVINIYLNAAIKHAEKYLGYPIMEQELEYYYDSIVCGSADVIGNASNLVSVTYDSSTTEDETFSTGSLLDYGLSRTIVLEDFPSDAKNIRIRVKAGFPDCDSVNENIKAAILLIAAKLFETREDTIQKMPTAAEMLLDLECIKTFV